MSTLEPGITGRRRKTGARKKKARRRKACPHPDAQTLSVPEAGWKYFGLSKQGSYDAADRGDIPTIRIGKKLRRVPIHAMERTVERLLGEAEKERLAEAGKREAAAAAG